MKFVQDRLSPPLPHSVLEAQRQGATLDEATAEQLERLAAQCRAIQSIVITGEVVPKSRPGGKKK